MVAAGIGDILVAYPVVGEIKVDRLMNVAKRARVTVADTRADPPRAPQ